MTFTTFKITAVIVLISLRTSCHGKHHEEKPKIEILKNPPSTIKVLTGSTIDLFWCYRVEPIDIRLKQTSLFYDIGVENRKSVDQLIRKIHGKGGLPEANPSLTKARNGRTGCNFTLVDQIWRMDCRITDVIVEDSGVYGVYIETEHEQLWKKSATVINVVDIMFNPRESDFVLQSWFGRKTELNCAIYRKVKMETKYEWSVVTENKDITRGITRRPNKTSYTFIPLSKRDFGKYRCTISTASTRVEHTIVLQQIDYPGAPRDLKILLPQHVGDVRIVWKRPLSNGGSKIIDYAVQTRLHENVIWVDTGTTTKLLVAVTNLNTLNRYEIRVCSRNKVGIGARSCTVTKKVHVGQLGKRNSGCASIIPFKYTWMMLLILSVI